MTTVNDSFNRDLNSLVKNKRKASSTVLQAASLKQPISATRGSGTNVSGQTSAIASPLTEVSRVEASFIVNAGGTAYVPTQVTFRDANGEIVVFNFNLPTIE